MLVHLNEAGQYAKVTVAQWACQINCIPVMALPCTFFKTATEWAVTSAYCFAFKEELLLLCFPWGFLTALTIDTRVSKA